MSNPKILDLPIDELKKIALAINKNTAANKIKNKEDKIPTDKFIRKYGLNRKDFSETIKNTDIKYNKSTFFYDTENVNFPTTKVNSSELNKSSLKENYSISIKQPNTYKDSNAIQEVQKNTFQLPNEFKELLSLTGDLKEMVVWYKNQTNTNIIEVPDLNLNNSKLNGVVITRSFKMYKGIAEEFSKFAEHRKEKQKDLISIAILEFINKYK